MCLLVVVGGLGGCSAVGLLNATIPKSGFVRTADMAYGEQPRQMLDVYRPLGVDGPLPVVVFFYGGDWQAGSKDDYLFAAQALTSRGFIAVLPDYRLYPQVVFPAFVQDGAKAVRWVHEHIRDFGGDPDRLLLMGHSSGAYIAGLLALDKHYLKDVGVDHAAIRAAALLAGPYAFLPTGIRRNILGVKPGHALPDPSTQVITFVDGTQLPLLLLQGLDDMTVNPTNTRDLTRKIHERGGVVRTIYYPDRGHVGLVLSLAHGFRWLDPTLNDVTCFFNQLDQLGK